MTTSTLFPRCDPATAPAGSPLACGAIRPITQAVHWDTTGCPVPAPATGNGCEQCPPAVAPPPPPPAPAPSIPDGCYTQVCFTGNVPVYGQAPAPAINFGQTQEWCMLGVKYTYSNGVVTKSGTAIPDGTYTQITIQNGCIVAAGSAPLPVYQPAECCDTTGGTGANFTCADVPACLATLPYAGVAPSTVRFVASDGRLYTIDMSGTSGGTFDCDDVLSCIQAFPNGGTATSLTQLIGADGKKYFVPIPSASSGINSVTCGGLEFSGGRLIALPTTSPASAPLATEFGWPPILGAQGDSFLGVEKLNCRLVLTIDEPLLLSTVLNNFAEGTAVPDATEFLAQDGKTYTIEQIAAKIDSILQITQLKAQVNTIASDLAALKARYDSHTAHPPP